MAILILLLISGLRLWLTVSYEVPSGLKNRGYHKIYLYPRFVKELLFSILLYIMSVLFTIVLIFGFLTNQVDNYIVHIGLLIFLSFWLFIGNMFFMRPAGNYWITIKEKNMLSIGSIVRLKDGAQNLMILNRAPLIEEGGTANSVSNIAGDAVGGFFKGLGSAFG